MVNKPSIPLNQILRGDCISLLADLPASSVDLVFADPPYNLQLRNDLFRPNMSKVDAVDDGWDKFASFAEYDEFTRKWLAGCQRVLKDTGTIWVIGSYHNIYRVGALMQDLGFWILNDVVWVKCLSGDTELLALINKHPILSTIKDLVRIDTESNTIELPSINSEGQQTWVTLKGWRNAGTSNGLRLEFDNGYAVECTNDHQFPVAHAGNMEFKAAQDLVEGDFVLSLGRLEIPRVIESNSIDKSVGELIGWYLAEGSMLSEGKGIQLSMSADEQEEAEALINLVKEKFGVAGRVHIYNKSLILVFPGRFMIELIKRFIRGENAKTKRITREALWHGEEFLNGILIGYLKGDGHWDAKNQRWRLGFTKNKGLLMDLRLISHITNYRIHARDGLVPYKDSKVEIIRGEIRENKDRKWSMISLESLGLPTRGKFAIDQEHSIQRLRRDYRIVTRKSKDVESLLAKQVIYGDVVLSKIIKIQRTNLKTFYDLSVDGNNVFALPSGVLTHNSNPMPNFRGVRFTNAHETLIWAQKKQGAKYTFNHQAMKALNDDLQMRSDWNLPLATGKERIKSDGVKAHSTQKPEALLYRVMLSSTNVGDVVLDPFFGSGTTGAVAKKLGRHFIGIERDAKYVRVAKKRIEAVTAASAESLDVSPPKPPRVPFGNLVESGMLKVGQTLFFAHGSVRAKVLANGHIKCKDEVGSIHAIAKSLTGAPSNGWDMWLYEDVSGKKLPIDHLREEIRKQVVM